MSGLLITCAGELVDRSVVFVVFWFSRLDMHVCWFAVLRCCFLVLCSVRCFLLFVLAVCFKLHGLWFMVLVSWLLVLGVCFLFDVFLVCGACLFLASFLVGVLC